MMWSSEIIMNDVVFRDDHDILESLWIDETFITDERVVGVEEKKSHKVSGISAKFCLEFSKFRKVELHI